jgi:hypothetical protein|tara:strand:+ start:142 stop:267 length:126 start_codon:yes stop_codon:yes gene_type:complete
MKAQNLIIGLLLAGLAPIPGVVALFIILNQPNNEKSVQNSN